MEDPTLETTQITLGGKTYTLCFDLEALAEAETALIQAGVPGVNLLQSLSLGSVNLQGMRSLFAASLRKFQPTLKPKEAMALVTTRNLYKVWNAVIEGWTKAVGGDAQSADAGEGAGEDEAPLDQPTAEPDAG